MMLSEAQLADFREIAEHTEVPISVAQAEALELVDEIIKWRELGRKVLGFGFVTESDMKRIRTLLGSEAE